METKVCKICGVEKNISDFYYRKENHCYRSECKKCLLDKQKIKYIKKEKIPKQIPTHKICTKCNIDKEITNFRKNSKGYINSICIDCENRLNMERYYNKKMHDESYVERKKIEEKNKKIINENKKICIICKQEKDLSDFYYRKDINKYRNWCIACEKKRTKDFYLENKDNILEKQHVQYQFNKEIILKRKKDYAKTHKDQLKVYHTNYVHNRRNNDEIFHFKSQVRHLINQSFRRRGIQKKGKTEEIVGCDFETFSKYLLKTFKDNYGYDWDGKEEVHIDHIKPLAKANTQEEILNLCHYTNLQLLKAKDNLDKKDKTDWKLYDE